LNRQSGTNEPTASATSDAEVRERRTDALRSFIATWIALDAVASIVVLLMSIAVIFLVVDHPYRLLVALILSLPVVRPLARMFFTSTDQFIEDCGLTTDEGLISQFLGLREIETMYGRFASAPTIDLSIIWFLVSWSSIVAGAYQLLGLVLAWFHT
jgi:hypothetical protein